MPFGPKDATKYNKKTPTKKAERVTSKSAGKRLQSGKLASKKRGG